MGRFDELDTVVKGLGSLLPNGMAVMALNGAGDVLYEGSTNADLTLEQVTPHYHLVPSPFPVAPSVASSRLPS
jgi:hypothetical protein